MHSNNSLVALSDEEDRIVYRKRLPNDIGTILQALAPYKEQIVGIVVESTYNWYWLVDGLMEAGYICIWPILKPLRIPTKPATQTSRSRPP